MKIKKLVKNFVNAQLVKKGFVIRNKYYFNFFEGLLYKYLREYGTIKFVQIGANDGKRFDPIHAFVKSNDTTIKGIVVEPVKDYYKDLVITYKNHPNVRPLNLAIHNTLKESYIYKVDKKFEAHVPEFALGIASFDKEHHKKTNIPSAYMTKEKVNCLTFKMLIEEHKYTDLDVLVLDAEGYDYEILTNIEFETICPKIIYFEHGLKSGTMSEKQFKELFLLLQNKGYQLFAEEADITAYKTGLFLPALSNNTFRK